MLNVTLRTLAAKGAFEDLSQGISVDSFLQALQEVESGLGQALAPALATLKTSPSPAPQNAVTHSSAPAPISVPEALQRHSFGTITSSSRLATRAPSSIPSTPETKIRRSTSLAYRSKTDGQIGDSMASPIYSGDTPVPARVSLSQFKLQTVTKDTPRRGRRLDVDVEINSPSPPLIVRDREALVGQPGASIAPRPHLPPPRTCSTLVMAVDEEGKAVLKVSDVVETNLPFSQYTRSAIASEAERPALAEPFETQESSSRHRERQGTPSRTPAFDVFDDPDRHGFPLQLSPGVEISSPLEQKRRRLGAFMSPNLKKPTFPRGASQRSYSSSLASDLIPAEVLGMGRVLLDKNVLFDRLGQREAEMAMARASATFLENPSPAIGLPFQPSREDLIAARPLWLENRAFSEPLLVDSDAALPNLLSYTGRDKVRMIQAWLDSPEMMQDAARDAWTTIPREWDRDLDQAELDMREQFGGYTESEGGMGVKEEDGEREVLQVRGKSFVKLLKSKRKFDTLESGLNTDLESTGVVGGGGSTGQASGHRHKKSRSRSTLDKRRSNQDSRDEGTIGCVCDRGDDGEAMVQCDACRAWYHLDCLNISDEAELPDTWFCPSCSTEAMSNGPKDTSHTFPFLSLPAASSEPILVAGSFSPRQSTRTIAAHLALAPSPRSTSSHGAGSSPSLFAPALPMTPRVGNLLSDHSYSPRSPHARRRNATMAQWAHPSDMSESDRQKPWDSFLQPPSFGYDCDQMLVGDDPRSLFDVPSTPQSKVGGNIPGLRTPTASSRGVGRYSWLMGQTTPSQDFLNSLHSGQAAPSTPTSSRSARHYRNVSHHLAYPGSPTGPYRTPLSMHSAAFSPTGSVNRTPRNNFRPGGRQPNTPSSSSLLDAVIPEQDRRENGLGIGIDGMEW